MQIDENLIWDSHYKYIVKKVSTHLWLLSPICSYLSVKDRQRRACKLILRNEYSNLEEAQNRLNMLSFSESVFLQKAKVMYKVSNNIAPEYLTDLFKMRESNSNSTLNLRSVSNKHFLIPKPKINLFKNSLSYSGALVWNSIPLDIKNSMTLNSFVQNCTFWLKGKYV